jgi:plastocyanin
LKTKCWVAITFGALILVSLSLSARPLRSAAPTAEVTIANFTFLPVRLEIEAGTKVTWTNKDDVPHTVVSDDQKTFKSQALDTGDQFSFTFAQPGSYKYFCGVHPKMTAEIVVK